MKNTMNNKLFNLKKLVITAVFTALITTLTYFMVPIAGGYIHLGDSMIYACAWAVGGVPAAIASAIGSCIADVLVGYPQYAIASLVIKFIMCYVCYIIMKVFSYRMGTNILAMVVASIIMAAGYCAYEYYLTGYGGMVAVIYGNLIQALAGVCIGSIIINTLNKVKALSPYISWKADRNEKN